MKKCLLVLTIALILMSKANVSFAQIANGSYRFSAKNTETNPKYVQVKAPINTSWRKKLDDNDTYETYGIYPIQQHDETFGDDQVFLIEKIEKDYYKITALATGKCFEANTTDPGISMTTYTGKTSQLWQMRLNSDGTYWVINKSKNTVLTVQGGDFQKNSGDLIIQEGIYPTPNIRSSQKFVIKPFEYSKKQIGATGNGLSATYNNGRNLQGTTSMSKIDASINFDPFNATNVPSGIPNDGNFSVSWEGQIESPFNGSVTFFMDIDDGVKVWINNKLVLQQESSATNSSFSVNMMKGEKSDVKIEYFNAVGSGKLIWSWSYPNQVKQIIPTKFLYATQLKDGVEISSQTPNQLIVIARDSINRTKLRWVAPSPTTWLKGVIRGYKVERFTTKINGVAQSQPYSKREWEVVAERKDSPKWASSMITNANVAKYSKSFQGNNTFVGSMYDILYGQSNTVLAYRYYSALLTSNLSYEAAKMAGMGFTDTQASDTEEYIYKVSFLDATSAIDPGQVIVQTNTGLPQNPEKPVSKFLNKVVRTPKPTDKCNGIDCDSLIFSLRWNTKITEKFYGSYWLEKKNNVTNAYERQNDFPFVTLSKVDSVITSDTIPYYNSSSSTYRVIGRSYFDEEFTSPDLVVTYTPPLDFVPEIIKSRLLDNGNLRNDYNAYIRWIYPNSDKFLPSDVTKIKAMISGYRIEKSNNPNDGFTTLMDNLPTTIDSTWLYLNSTSTTKLIIKDNTIYVRVVAIGVNGINTYSSSVMLMPYDTIPPTKPTFISSTLSADKKVVELRWQSQPNTETDFLKYALFRKNFTGDKYWIHISKKDTNLVIYNDTLNIGIDSDKLWYGLIAIDKRGNNSLMDSIQLVRPDTRPPMNPVFLRYKRNVDDTNVRIDWNLGDITDIKEYALYKNSVEGCPVEGWTALKTILTKPLPNDTTFTDTDIIKGKTYCYNIIVKDDANLSASAQPLVFEIPKIISRVAFGNSNFTANFVFDDKKTDVVWTYPIDPDLVSFELMRSETNLKDFTNESKYTPYSSWRILASSNLTTIDNDVIFNGKYSYAIRALFKDGTVTAWKEYNLTTPIGCKAGKLEIKRNQLISIFQSSIDKACSQIVLEPGFDSERKEYEAVIVK